MEPDVHVRGRCIFRFFGFRPIVFGSPHAIACDHRGDHRKHREQNTRRRKNESCNRERNGYWSAHACQPIRHDGVQEFPHLGHALIVKEKCRV